MRNFLKVSLKTGLLDYYREHVAISKYSHAFATILKVKPVSGPPSLTKDEKNYIRTAIWSEYQFENLPQSRTTLAIPSSSTAGLGKTSHIDHIIGTQNHHS
jgi:hypothetical protein